MTIEYNAARKAMFALFKTAWDSGSVVIAGYIPEVRYQGVEKIEKPPSNKHWARISTQTVMETQASLSNDVFEAGKKRFECSGLIFVQLFAPKSIAASFDELTKLAQVARDAFRGKKTANNEVWFRNSRINELGPEELFYRINVVSEFEFCELG